MAKRIDAEDMVDEVLELAMSESMKYGFVTMGLSDVDGKTVVHLNSKRCLKSLIGYYMIYYTVHMLVKEGNCVGAKIDMVYKRINDTMFFVDGRTHRVVNDAVAKQVWVMFKELSRCFPSSVVAVSDRISDEDVGAYVSNCSNSGEPVSKKLLDALENKLGIVQKIDLDK